jgi:hypothetical protein
VDNPERRALGSASLPKCQDEPRLPPSRDGCAYLPRGFELERPSVSSLVFFPSAPEHSLARRFRVRAKLTNGELVVRGDQWPLLVYANQDYNPEDPWNGLFRSQLLVWVT